MDFRFNYSVRPADLWVLTMVNIYRSMMGVINIVFTLSMVLLAVRFWDVAPDWGKLLITAGILLFPLLQPVSIFFRCRKIVGTMPQDIVISFEKKGITTSSGGQNSLLEYGSVRSVVRVFNMLIIYSRSKQGYILSDRILEGRGKELYNFLKKNVKSQSSRSRNK